MPTSEDTSTLEQILVDWPCLREISYDILHEARDNVISLLVALDSDGGDTLISFYDASVRIKSLEKHANKLSQYLQFYNRAHVDSTVNTVIPNRNISKYEISGTDDAACYVTYIRQKSMGIGPAWDMMGWVTASLYDIISRTNLLLVGTGREPMSFRDLQGMANNVEFFAESFEMLEECARAFVEGQGNLIETQLRVSCAILYIQVAIDIAGRPTPVTQHPNKVISQTTKRGELPTGDFLTPGSTQAKNIYKWDPTISDDTGNLLATLMVDYHIYKTDTNARGMNEMDYINETSEASFP